MPLSDESTLKTYLTQVRTAIWVWPKRGEALWIWSWSLAGGILAWRFRPLLNLGLAAGIALGILC